MMLFDVIAARPLFSRLRLATSGPEARGAGHFPLNPRRALSVT
jgi:hypothetical protein